MKLPWTKNSLKHEVKKLVLKPGDLLLWKFDAEPNHEEINYIASELKEILGPANQAIIIGPRDHISTLDERQMLNCGWKRV